MARQETDNRNSRTHGANVGRGLYRPEFEHDSCGVGFVAHLDARPRHEVVRDAVQVLASLEHRGALGGDRATGDGAGLLLELPDAFFRSELDLKLPNLGDYAVGMVFLPADEATIEECIRTFDSIAVDEGCDVLGWRDVPIDSTVLGELARVNLPRIKQVVLDRADVPAWAFERKLYVIRRLVEKAVAKRDDAKQFFVASLSTQTVVYKGMLVGSELGRFYPDLMHEQFAGSFALVHQRYSTNTFPTWALAQPFRMLAHNGEINTLHGNASRMRSREPGLASNYPGLDIEKIKPVIVGGGSDSAMLDNVLELLVMGGRSLPHAALMMLPGAWGDRYVLGPARRAFYEYHAAIMEPWDGPAAVVFTDGRYVGAKLDRNGLRPARYTITRDGLVVLASESGALDIPGDRILGRHRLPPGKMLLVDLEQNRLIPDKEIKTKVSLQKPYRRWVKENRVELRGLLMPSEISAEEPEVLLRKQHMFGYTREELKRVLGPMAARGQEAVGSMGNDAALAVLSERPQLLFAYFKQRFAQVTNPPIDPLREALVMSLMSFVGRQRNLLDETPEHCRQLKLHHPILTPKDAWQLRAGKHPDIVVGELDMLFPADAGPVGLEPALNEMLARAERLVEEGATILILTDRNAGEKLVPIPALLATSALHHHLIRRGLRIKCWVVVETGEAREVIHFALLIGYGANAVCPHVAFLTVNQMAESGELDAQSHPEDATDSYITAVKKGLLKTFSRMGISTIRSFFGSQIFEAVGLDRDLVDTHFSGTVSPIGGIGLPEIAREALARHQRAFPETGRPEDLLDVGNAYHHQVGGEPHLWSAEAIRTLQQATRRNDYAIFRKYANLTNEQSNGFITLRSSFRCKPGNPVPIDEVESVESICSRFAGAAMSLGSISRETHETIAIAFNRLGARSNSGEGGEAPERDQPLANGDSRRSRTRQIASGRFGVTIEYLMGGDELQIKIAQGAKPGEGGQLPGHKVSDEIARIRHTQTGVTLISPPPHHDIYSIEDIAQLIHDLKAANPNARVSVKLASEAGVGTIAAGVAKARADMVLIAGHDGGTGASPLTAIKHTGIPWELGLAETHQTLLQNRLRNRIRVQVDGQLRTGRDLAIAALLGAEEWGFGTVLLVALGCVMDRKCHLNTCPVGIATQDEERRKRFKGRPEYVERFLRFIAQDLREQMAEMGFRAVDEMVGRSDRLDVSRRPDHIKAQHLDFSPLVATGGTGERHCTIGQEHNISSPVDDEILRAAEPALKDGRPVDIKLPVRNVDRTIGTRLSGEIVTRLGGETLAPGTIRISLTGSAGQSLGAFLARGVSIRLEGDANDYVGKGLSGGKLTIVPPADATFASHQNVIIGNVALYGATGGELYVRGIAGERFAVRNSGAVAVVEGVGDHGCEYMTGGAVAVLGRTGYNFAAGMSGGVAYVYDESDLFETRCNLDMVDLESVWHPEDRELLLNLLETYLRETGSDRAQMILDNRNTCLPMFVKVMPIEYRRSLERMRGAEDVGDETVSATEEVFKD